MVVSAILFVVPPKKFALASTGDTWCIQMIDATKLAAMTFLE